MMSFDERMTLTILQMAIRHRRIYKSQNMQGVMLFLPKKLSPYDPRL